MSTFNEDSRVKIPALLHLTRLGYSYLSLKEARWDTHNNIFPELFAAALLHINPDLRRVNDEVNEESGERCAPGDGTELGNRIAEVPNGSSCFAGNVHHSENNTKRLNHLSDYRTTA